MPAARTKSTSRTPVRVSPYPPVDLSKRAVNPVVEDDSSDDEDYEEEESEGEICGSPRRAEGDDGYDGLVFIDESIKKAFDDFMGWDMPADALCDCEGEKDLVKLLEDVFKAGLVKGRLDAEKVVIQEQ